MVNVNVGAIARYLDEYSARWPFSGVVQICRNGCVEYERAAGMACHELSVENSIGTCFTLASVSKQFTAFAVMQLADEGLCDLDKPVNGYLPESLHVDGRITPHHLLSHTSGLRSFADFSSGFLAEYDKLDYCRNDYFNKFFRSPLLSAPGERYEYSNAGYNLLAWMLESVRGMPFGECLRERIFLPLGMAHSVLDDGSRIVSGKAFPYAKDRDRIVRAPYWNEKFSLGAGAVVSNAEDMRKWFCCLRDRLLISPKAYARFFNPNLNGYCYGLESGSAGGSPKYSHAGDHVGVRAMVQHFYELDMSMLILSNADWVNQYRIADALTSILFGGKAEIPPRLPLYRMTEQEARRCEGVYLPGKIELRRADDGLWDFSRFKGSMRISVYPVGPTQFASVHRDQSQPYSLVEGPDGEMAFFGFKKQACF